MKVVDGRFRYCQNLLLWWTHG